jgi:hypothetical protein
MPTKNRWERGNETFRWEYETYDISRLLRDLSRGLQEPILATTLNRDDIAGYRAVLEGVALVDAPEEVKEKLRVHIDLDYVSSLEEADLREPLVMLHVGQDEGTVRFEDLEPGANYVLADGNHRLIRAYQLQLPELEVLVIPREVAKRYVVARDDLID